MNVMGNVQRERVGHEAVAVPRKAAARWRVSFSAQSVVLRVIDVLGRKYSERSLGEEENHAPRSAYHSKDADDHAGQEPLLDVSVADQRQALCELAPAFDLPCAAKRK